VPIRDGSEGLSNPILSIDTYLCNDEERKKIGAESMVQLEIEVGGLHDVVALVRQGSGQVKNWVQES